jgi:hypothetical protein
MADITNAAGFTYTAPLRRGVELFGAKISTCDVAGDITKHATANGPALADDLFAVSRRRVGTLGLELVIYVQLGRR